LSPIQKCYHTGDTRAEDNNFLLFLQTLFVREHNRIARELKYTNPSWDDERLFQEARKICIGEYQHIIYNEWLPVVLGLDITKQYDLLPFEQGYSQGYNPRIRASIINEFAGAIFRFGHTLVKRNQYMADSNYRKVDDFPVDWYMFNPYIKESGNLEMCAKGSLMNHGYYFHPQVNEVLNDWLFNYTFPDIESKRFSLAALNIQRGRDHGFPRYNEYRRLCGLNYAYSFRDLHNIPEYARRTLAQLYEDVNDIDLFAGAMSEYPVKDGIVGATVSCNYLFFIF
jgi:peroxidase